MYSSDVEMRVDSARVYEVVVMLSVLVGTGWGRFFFFKQKTAYEI